MRDESRELKVRCLFLRQAGRHRVDPYASEPNSSVGETHEDPPGWV